MKVQAYGYVYLHGIKFPIAKQRAGKTMPRRLRRDRRRVFADASGEFLIERGWPPKG